MQWQGVEDEGHVGIQNGLARLPQITPDYPRFEGPVRGIRSTSGNPKAS